jgi:tRNA uridine 5-carbamoylmethylation protein Kti12
LKGDKNTVFADSRQEKEVRGRLKSEVIRLLNKESLLICDGLNYIKGGQTARVILVRQRQCYLESKNILHAFYFIDNKKHCSSRINETILSKSIF